MVRLPTIWRSTAISTMLLALLAGCATDPRPSAAHQAELAYRSCTEQVADRYIPNAELPAGGIANQALSDCDDEWQAYKNTLSTEYLRRTRSINDARRFAIEDALHLNIRVKNHLIKYIERVRTP